MLDSIYRFLEDNCPGIKGKRILEVGSLVVNGSPRYVYMDRHPAEYIGVDVAEGPGVDLAVSASALVERFGRASFDMVVSTDMLEHCEDWRTAIRQMKAVLKPGGHLFLTVRAPGFPYHHQPDCWRFTREQIGKVFSDMRVLRLEADPQAPGVFLWACKDGSGSGEGVLEEIDPEHACLKFAVITPTVMRPSLRAACASLERQSYGSWHHVVAIDDPSWAGRELPSWLNHPKRTVTVCPVAHNDYGNRCRNGAFDLAAHANYFLYLDDDHEFIGEALADLSARIMAERMPDWGVFPIEFWPQNKQKFFDPDPGHGKTAVCQIFHCPLIRGRSMVYPPVSAYAADGWFVELLKVQCKPRMLDMRSLVKVPKNSYGAR